MKSSCHYNLSRLELKDLCIATLRMFDMQSFRLLIVLLLLLSILCTYLYVTRNFGFFERQGIRVIRKPYPFTGTREIRWKTPFHEYDKNAYEELGKVFGAYEGSVPVLYIADLTLVKRIFVEDFHTFPVNSHTNVLQRSHSLNKLCVTHLHGDKWRIVHAGLQNAFSHEKMKELIPSIQERTESLIENIKCLPETEFGKPVDIYDLMLAFSIDVVAQVIFGLKIDTLKDPGHPFVINTKNVVDPSATELWCEEYLPPFLKTILRKDNYSYFIHTAVSNLLDRKQSGEIQVDFLELMLEAQEEENFNRQFNYRNSQRQVFSDYLIVAHLIMFLFTAVNTVASALTFTFYALACNPSVQRRMEQEIHFHLQQNGGIIDGIYLAKLQFTDMVIAESLRMFPPLVRSERVCRRNSRLRGCIIKEGMMIYIPIYAIHRDPQLYPEPEEFKPERFVNSHMYRNPLSYIPFGVGPRKCLGKQLALLEMKICLVCLIENFQVFKIPTTDLFSYRLGSTILKPSEEGLWLSLKARKPPTLCPAIILYERKLEERKRKRSICAPPCSCET